MKKFIIIFILLFLTAGSVLYAGNDALYILNLPVSETTGQNIFLLDVGHRYFDVNKHTTNINLSLGYGITDRIDAHAAYSFKNKDIVLFSKANILNDKTGNSLFSLSFVAGAGYKDTNEMNNSVSISYADNDGIEATTILEDDERCSFFSQVIIQKYLFMNRLSAGLVPTYAYNTNFYGIENTDLFSAGCGVFAEFYFFDRVAACAEAVINIYGFAFKYMTYNAGLKYSGYRHTFTLWIGNSAGYSPVEYITGNNTLTPKFSFAFTREFDL